MIDYNRRMKTVERLFCDYAHENGRVNRQDAEITQRLICEELHRRLDAALAALGEVENFEDGELIYAKFIDAGRI